MLSKLTDAASMFYYALDDHERRLLVIAGAWLAGVVLFSLTSQAERRREERLLELVDRRIAGGA